MTTLADRSLEIHLRGRSASGSVRSRRSPVVVRDAGSERAFVVTDPGVMRSGVAAQVVDALEDVGIGTSLFDEVEPNPGTTTVARGSGRAGLVRPGGHGRRPGRWRLVDGQRQGDGAPRANGEEVWPRLPPRRRRSRRPGRRGPDDRGHRARRRTPTGSSPTRRPGARTTSGIRPCCRAGALLDPALTVGVPPAATAATGVDAMTHSLESLLSREPQPVRRGDRAGGHPDRRDVAAAGRSPTARTSRRARSCSRPAPAGVGQQSGTGVGLVHALGHAIGTRGRLPHGLALAVIEPEVLPFYAATPACATASCTSSASRSARRPRPRTPATGAVAAIGALRGFLAEPACARPCVARVRRRGARRRRPGRDRRRGHPELPAAAVPRGGSRDPLERGLGGALWSAPAH